MSEPPDSDRDRKQRVFRAVMLGLMAGSAMFLAERYLLKIEVETALVVATGIAVAVTVHLLQQITRN